MSIDKQAAEAVNMLMAQGVDFESASELVMEKVAGTGASIYFHGAAKAERKVAAEYGQEGPKKTFWGDYRRNNESGNRAGGRGILTAAASGIAAHAGASALANRAVRRGATTMGRAGVFKSTVAAGAGLAGYIGGVATSYKNQGKEMHEKYREKSAALNMLMDQGVDFETAADLVMEKAAFLGAITGAMASTDGHRWGGAGVGLGAGIAGSVVGGAIAGAPGMVAGSLLGGALGGKAYGRLAAKKDQEKKVADALAIHEAIKAHSKSQD